MKSLPLRYLGIAALALFASAAHACSICGSAGLVHPAGEVVYPGEYAAGSAVAAAAAPSLSSRPGAAYTMYLNFDGFAFNGNWGGDASYTPGTTAAYGGTAAQATEIWARTAEKYAAFNINVTTVDPAIAAGMTANDTVRQNYYDSQARLMHTVIGSGTWTGGGGISYVNVTQYNTTGSNGYHTNFVFPNRLGGSTATKAIAEATAHEQGHGVNLDHQGDKSPLTIQEYSSNGGANGNASFAPIMGNSYTAQRGAWRVGSDSNKTAPQNDVFNIVSNSGLDFVDDGIGHSFAAASLLPLNGTSVNASLAHGVIMPISETAPTPLGINNYTKDYFRFSMGSTGTVTLNLADGGDWITPGVAAVGATLRSNLYIYQAGNLATPFAFATEATNTLSSIYTGTLTAGDYFAEITSFGGVQSSFDNTAQYFTMGSYVLSGSGITPVIVPEGGTFILLGVGLVGFVIRRRRK